MEKVSVTVRAPALHGSYDFIVPDNMAVRDVQNLMVKILESEYGVSGKSDDFMLLDMSDGEVLRLECSFKQLGISDGARLMLV
ncbi:MAG: hypothetical protein HFH14_10285 [Lachnospiraceae bacterium]|nr:hypothetical protein [Lachnospiraceae bacterium]